MGGVWGGLHTCKLMSLKFTYWRVVHVEITRQGRCEALRCRSSLRNPIKAYNSMWEGYRQHTAQIYCYPGTRSLEKQAGHCCLSVCAAQGGRASTQPLLADNLLVGTDLRFRPEGQANGLGATTLRSKAPKTVVPKATCARYTPL